MKRLILVTLAQVMSYTNTVHKICLWNG